MVDILLPAESQVSPALYGRAVGIYQWAKPRCGFEGCCRFQPSCSHYSVEVVQRFGILNGLWLTADRIDRCRTNIPKGTQDPVPHTQEQNRVPGVINSRVPHHPAYGSVQGGSNQRGAFAP